MCTNELAYDIARKVLEVIRYGDVIETIEDVELTEEQIEEHKVEMHSPYYFGLWDDGELIDIYKTDICDLIEEYDLDDYFY